MTWTAAIRAKRHPPKTDSDYLAKLKGRLVENSDGCWIYTGTIGSIGYGQMYYRGRKWDTHRLMYLLTKGDPEGQHVCHTCDIPACCNPDHLWLGTHGDNAQDALEKGRHFQAAKTHCPRGHAYAEHGVRRADGKRKCLLCERDRYHREKQGKTTPNKDKTHCIHGHPLSGDNLYVNPNNGRRQCKLCRAIGIRKLTERRRNSTAVRESGSL